MQCFESFVLTRNQGFIFLPSFTIFFEIILAVFYEEAAP